MLKKQVELPSIYSGKSTTFRKYRFFIIDKMASLSIEDPWFNVSNICTVQIVEE